MKKIAFGFFVMSMFSVSAYADYFKCEIEQLDTVLASAEAPYRSLEAKASAYGFDCEGKIVGSRTFVKLTDTLSGRVREENADGSVASTYLSVIPRHNEYDIICTCGMN
jgi:hypothetical protein